MQHYMHYGLGFKATLLTEELALKIYNEGWSYTYDEGIAP
jgi:hypothetical protein